MTPSKPKIRLYVAEPYKAGAPLVLSEGQSHYVAHVMRADVGDAIAVFNGVDGQWLASVSEIRKKQVTLALESQSTPQQSSSDLWLAFSPVKNKNEFIAEKATELGVAKLIAVFTQHAVVKSVNEEKLMAHTIEAAEQCERLDVPTLETAKDLGSLLANWPKDRVLLHGDESGAGTPIAALAGSLTHGKYGVLIGPEGGFSVSERCMLKTQSYVKGFSLGPRILKADTAVIAALSCVQAIAGDWKES